MTDSEHTTDEIPDHVLEEQAWSEGLAPKRPTGPSAPPHDTDAEVYALGAMLLSRIATEKAIERGLDGRHFYTPAHQQIYDAICTVVAEGAQPEPAVVAGALGWPAQRTGYLFELVGQAPATSNVLVYVGRIISAHTARQIQGAALEVAHAAGGGQLDEALRLVTKLTDELPTDETEGGWAPLDLTDALTGESTGPVPTLLEVEGGPPLFYVGRTNLIFGESGAGKTWVALAAVAETIRRRASVAYIDLEDTPEGLVGRLRAMGLPPELIAKHLLYLQPELAWGPTAQAALASLIDRHGVELVVLDSTGEAMAADGVKGNDDDDVARWFTACPKYLARRGPAVIIIDHIPKDDQNAPLSPIGSQRKKAAIDGAAYRIDAPKAPSKGHDGLLVATVSKDRHGTRHKGQKAAQVAITHDPDIEGVLVAVSAPSPAPKDAEGHFRPTIVMEAVSRLVEDTPGLSGRQIESRVSGKAKVIREATRMLTTEGYIGQDPDARSFAYVSVRPFRADADEAPEPTEEAS